MAHEIELKLSLSPAHAQMFREDAILGPAQHSEFLYSQYFDTPDLALNKAACALRIRKTGDGFVQTLKTKGIAIGGLHQRGEWEVPVAGESLNWLAFPEHVQVDTDLQKKIGPAFTTNFQRYLWNTHHGQSEIELVLDEGHIACGARKITLCEIELELKSGDAADLFDFARALCARYVLVPCDISKAERGYRLLVPQLSFYRPLQPAKYNTDASLMAALLQDGLTRISRRWDNFCESRDWWQLAVLLRQLNGLNGLRACVSGMPGAQHVLDQVEPLFECLTVCLGLFVDGASEYPGLSQRLLKQLEIPLNAELEDVLRNNVMGLYLLQMGEFLFRQAHTLQASGMQATLQHWAQHWQEPAHHEALAFVLSSFKDERYALLNTAINQCYVVQAMARAGEFSRAIRDDENRAKLASWQRRLTVEQRTLQEVQGQMDAFNKEALWPTM